MSRTHRPLPALLLLAGLSAACTLTFPPGAFQSLQLFFELSAALAEGEESVVQTLVLHEEVKLKKRFVSVAGSIEPDGGAALPGRVELVAETADLETGKVLHRFKLTLKIDGSGAFGAVKKFKKNLAAGSMTTVSVEPVGAPLDRGARIRLCVDVVARRGDVPPCSSGGPPGPTTFSAIQDEIFTPSCADIGCHDSASASAGLSLAAGESYAELVNVPSNQVPFRLRVEPGSPDNSYLMMKLEGAAGIEGVRMPLDGPPFLTEAQLEGIATWIRSGARQD